MSYFAKVSMRFNDNICTSKAQNIKHRDVTMTTYVAMRSVTTVAQYRYMHVHIYVHTFDKIPPCIHWAHAITCDALLKTSRSTKLVVLILVICSVVVFPFEWRVCSVQ